MRYAHTNIIAKDWRAVSAFYKRVFGCTPVPPERDLSGPWMDALTGIAGARITGEHLALPGYPGKAPTLEDILVQWQRGGASQSADRRRVRAHRLRGG